MSFSADWLAQRASFDLAARSSALERRLVEWAGYRSGLMRVVDMAAGSGNNSHHLRARLPKNTKWDLVDADAALLSVAEERMPEARLRQLDLTADLVAAIPDDTDLVTASALIDLVSEAWLERLTERVREVGAALYIVLTYDGRIEWIEEQMEDRRIQDLVNQHQRRDKGFGPALGPHAPDALSRLLPVEAEASDWIVAPDQADFRQALVDGWAQAATEQDPTAAKWIEDWRRDAGSTPREVTVGHVDQLWLPN